MAVREVQEGRLVGERVQVEDCLVAVREREEPREGVRQSRPGQPVAWGSSLARRAAGAWLPWACVPSSA